MRTALLRSPFLTLALVLAGAGAAFAQHPCERLEAAPAASWPRPLDARVTLHLRDVALRDALDHLSAQSHTPLAYSSDVIHVDQRVCINVDEQPLGAVLATLLSATGVQVLVVAGRVVLSPGATGALPAGSAHSMSILERVVVTGNAVAAPRRPLAIGVEVIDGEQLRRQALGSLSELLDAAVPGVWAWNQGPSSLVAQYGGIRGSSSFLATYPKIYIDGVEVANPLIVTQLNPEVIDRVEVIRGPQGSALYGSDAISGVINILTRHDGGGISPPYVSVRSVAGASSSAYAAGLVPTHEQQFTFRAGSNISSAGLSATYGQTGALYPSSDSRQLAATGDARYVGSGATFTATARVFDKRAGIGRNPLFDPIIALNNPPQSSGPGGQGSSNGSGGGNSSQGAVLATTSGSKQSVRQYTLSTNTSIATDGPWTHTILAGVDGYKLQNIAEAIGAFPIALDSALRAAAGNGDRFTVRGSSVAKFGTEGESEGSITVGIEESVLRQQSSVVTRVEARQGEAYGTAVDGMVETWNHDTGILSQVNMSWINSVFVTGGLRLERNDSFSGSNRYPLLPMIGVAAVRGYGDTEMKWRVAYGKGIRPPQTPASTSASGYTRTLSQSTLGNVVPALDPEVQAGYEGGVELYVGRALSLQLTRFDQDATGLIQYVATGVDTFARGSGFERRVRYQLQNVGEISNTGWELQGNATAGAFSIASALSSVDSRVRTLAFGYNGDLRPGDRMLAVPARTGSFTASFLSNGWFGSVGANRAWDWINYDKLAIAKAYATPGSLRELTGGTLRNYWKLYDGDTHLRLTVSRDIARGVSLQVIGDNLLGGQLGEPDNSTIRSGRTVTGGLRASF